MAKITLQTCFESALNKHGVRSGMFALNQYSGNYINLYVQASFMRLRINRPIWKAKNEANEIIQMCKVNYTKQLERIGNRNLPSNRYNHK